MQAASRYATSDDLWIITTYYNPYRYQNRRKNYEIFTDSLSRSELHWLTVENAFGEQSFELTPGPQVIQVRSPHVLWQKERLLNLALRHLPPQVSKVAWLDCDLLFINPDWALETADLLDQFPVVQPFEGRIRLGPQGEPVDTRDTLKPSFAYQWAQNHQFIHSSEVQVHGSPGCGWAARRSILEQHGLYDCWLSGMGDHVMAHAMVGDFDGPCIRSARLSRPMIKQERAIQKSSLWQRVRRFVPAAIRKGLWKSLQTILTRQVNQAYWDHFLAWGQPFYADVQGHLGATPGTVLHLWHGMNDDRMYGFSQSEFNRLKFNPAVDLRLGPSGCWEWASDKPELHRWAVQFFEQRKEDG